MGDKIEDKTSGRRTHHPTKGNKKGDKRREDLGKAEGGHLKKALRTLTVHCLGKKCKMRPHATKGNKKRDKLGDKMGDKTSRRRTHHPTPRRTP